MALFASKASGHIPTEHRGQAMGDVFPWDSWSTHPKRITWCFYETPAEHSRSSRVFPRNSGGMLQVIKGFSTKLRRNAPCHQGFSRKPVTTLDSGAGGLRQTPGKTRHVMDPATQVQIVTGSWEIPSQSQC